MEPRFLVGEIEGCPLNPQTYRGWVGRKALAAILPADGTDVVRGWVGRTRLIPIHRRTDQAFLGKAVPAHALPHLRL